MKVRYIDYPFLMKMSYTTDIVSVLRLKLEAIHDSL